MRARPCARMESPGAHSIPPLYQLRTRNLWPFDTSPTARDTVFHFARSFEQDVNLVVDTVNHKPRRATSHNLMWATWHGFAHPEQSDTREKISLRPLSVATVAPKAQSCSSALTRGKMQT